MASSTTEATTVSTPGPSADDQPMNAESATDQRRPTERQLPPGVGEARKLLLSLFGASTGRREASKRNTRLAIRLAAFDLFQHEGIDKVTVEQIATKADISPRTFFNYFATKEECVVFPYQVMAPAFRKYLAAQPAELRPMAAMEEALATLLGDIMSQPDYSAAIKVAVNLHRTAPSLALADASHKQHWEVEAQAELISRGSDPYIAHVCAVAGVGIGRGALINWARSDNDRSVSSLVRAGFRGLQAGFDPIEQLAET